MSGLNDSGYRGCQYKTISGKICQDWNLQTPHAHPHTPGAYPNMGIDFVGNNLCRNPDSSATMGGSIWCYTTDPSIAKEECLPIGFCENTLTKNGITSSTIQFGDPLIVFSANYLFTNSQNTKCPIK